jgi:hypothetical protein
MTMQVIAITDTHLLMYMSPVLAFVAVLIGIWAGISPYVIPNVYAPVCTSADEFTFRIVFLLLDWIILFSGMWLAFKTRAIP